MKWIKLTYAKIRTFVSRRFLKENMSIPRKKDNTLDETAISKIYIVYDPNGTPIFVVAITIYGPQTETATSSLIAEIQNSSIPYEESSLEDYVYHYHIQEQLQDLRKKMKFKK
jgi:hypothetical protein